MKLVVQVKLLPTPEQASALQATLHACNRAAIYASQVAGPADVVAGVNVRDRARSAWVFVTAPAPSP
ncbi:hypothetical protein [Streptomyces sp. NPDC050121]|uniref:hypothetical protein n=1 Tax=Streptomyces sp. NPDC050121 TaxID=3365601 RepID=UPI0037A37997